MIDLMVVHPHALVGLRLTIEILLGHRLQGNVSIPVGLEGFRRRIVGRMGPRESHLEEERLLRGMRLHPTVPGCRRI